jgi:hypothetical protein
MNKMIKAINEVCIQKDIILKWNTNLVRPNSIELFVEKYGLVKAKEYDVEHICIMGYNELIRVYVFKNVFNNMYSCLFGTVDPTKSEAIEKAIEELCVESNSDKF